jgi:hypothetical protein
VPFVAPVDRENDRGDDEDDEIGADVDEASGLAIEVEQRQMDERPGG